MVHIQIFPKKIEQNLSTSLPSAAHALIDRVANDVMRKSRSGGLEKHLEFAHATLHMKLYQRFGRSASHYAVAAGHELDRLVHEAVAHSQTSLGANASA